MKTKTTMEKGYTAERPETDAFIITREVGVGDADDYMTICPQAGLNCGH